MTDLIERLRENVAEVPDTYWPGRMKEYAAEAADEIERLKSALESIANNTCCEGCQEAKRVALAALETRR